MNSYKDYKHIIPIQIRFADIDRLNHVNNACYHNYFELGRVRYFNHVLAKGINWDDNGFVLARTVIDHIESVYLDDEIYCCTKVSRLGNKSLTINNLLLRKINEEIVECAVCEGILVAMDYKTNQSIVIPDKWREQFKKFEELE